MWSSIWAIFIKELLHIQRDRLTLMMVLFIPVMQLALFGYAIETDVKHIKTVVLNQDNRAMSRQLLDDFVNTGYFDITATVTSEKEVFNQITTGDAWVGIIIPPDYSANLIGRRTTAVQVLVDGSNSTVANQALNLARGIGQNRSIQMVQGRMSELVGAPVAFNEPLEIRAKALFNPDLKSANFMIPGLLGVIMQLVTVMLTSFSIVREREKGTLEQLIVTPVKPYELMLGKLLPYFIIGLLNMLMVIFLMVVLFGVNIAGSLWLLLALSLFFLMTSLSIGLLISTVAQNQVQALQMTMMVFLPSMLLSGFMFPRESMPTLIAAMGYLVPLTYFLQILRGIILRGTPMDALWPHVIPIILFGVLLIGISTLRFRKQIG